MSKEKSWIRAQKLERALTVRKRRWVVTCRGRIGTIGDQKLAMSPHSEDFRNERATGCQTHRQVDGNESEKKSLGSGSFEIAVAIQG